MTDHLQNDPDRAGGLIADAQGEFVEQESGGVFDPRAFRSGDSTPARSADSAGPAHSADSSGSARPGPGAGAEPPMDDERMVGPGEEIDKAR